MADSKLDSKQFWWRRQSLRKRWRDEHEHSAAVRRNRIDRLLALVLDNADAFVDALAAVELPAQSRGAASVGGVRRRQPRDDQEVESLPDRGSRKIAPTVVRDIDDRMRIADDEIFGPVLVVRRYSEVADAIDYINQRPAPLVAYWYGPDNDDFRRFVRNTRSGGVGRNDFAAQMIPSAAPFTGSMQAGSRLALRMARNRTRRRLKRSR